LGQLLEQLDAVRARAQRDADRAVIRELSKTVRERRLDLPRVPDVARELMTLSAESTLGFREIAELVGRDQDLTARVLQVANSPVYMRRTDARVDYLDRAVALLGVETFRNIVIGVVTGAAVYKVPGFEKAVGRERAHAFETAVVSSELARQTGLRSLAGPAYLAGLMHDAGRVLVLRNLSNARRELGIRVADLSKSARRWLADELHITLGLYYAIHRDLAPAVRDVIVYHHTPLQAPQRWRELVELVALVDAASESQLPLGSSLHAKEVAARLDAVDGERVDPDTRRLIARAVTELKAARGGGATAKPGRRSDNPELRSTFAGVSLPS